MNDFHHLAIERFPFNTPAGYDHKAWAKRIMYRVEMKDPSLLPIQVTFAQPALDIKPGN